MSAHPKVVELLELLGCCVEAMVIVVRAAVAILFALVALAAVAALLAGAPTPLWRCASTISDTAHGVTHTYCAD